MLVKSCRKLKIGSLCSCFSSQKPPSRVNRLQTQGFPQCPTAPSGRSHFCSGGAVCLPGLPSPLPLAFSFSISALWLVVFGHPSPATPPPFFPFLLLLFLFYSLIFGHPQRKDETAGGKGAEGGPGFPKPGFCRHPWVRVFKLLGGQPGQVPSPHQLCIQGLTMTPGTQGWWETQRGSEQPSLRLNRTGYQQPWSKNTTFIFEMTCFGSYKYSTQPA